jgi:parvulin-like peptidyl-prolyl isomerase
MKLFMRTTIALAVATGLAVYVFTPTVARASNDNGSLAAVLVRTSEQGDTQVGQSGDQGEMQAEQTGEQRRAEIQQSGEQGDEQVDQNVEQAGQSGEQQS